MTNIDMHKELIATKKSIVMLARVVHMLATKLVDANMLTEDELNLISSNEDLNEIEKVLDDQTKYYTLLSQPDELSDEDIAFLRNYTLKFGSESDKADIDGALNTIIFSKTLLKSLF